MENIIGFLVSDMQIPEIPERQEDMEISCF